MPQKLSILLQLPSHIRLDHATISTLKVTIPADLHTSAIVIDIDGINIKARVVQDLDLTADNTASASSVPRRPFGSEKHARSKFASLSDDSNFMLRPNDLAKSFLADEPLEAKEQLETALDSQPVDLRQSVSSVSTSDDEPVGTGTGLALPAFLTNFFQGVGDRLEVSVKNVQVSVEVNIPADQSEADSGTVQDELFIIRFETERVDIEGVTTAMPANKTQSNLQALATDQTQSKPAPASPSAQSCSIPSSSKRRLIKSTKIRGSLLQQATTSDGNASYSTETSRHIDSAPHSPLSSPPTEVAQSSHERGALHPTAVRRPSIGENMAGVATSITSSAGGTFADADESDVEDDVLHHFPARAQVGSASLPISRLPRPLHDSLRSFREERQASASASASNSISDSMRSLADERSPKPLLFERRSSSRSFMHNIERVPSQEHGTGGRGTLALANIASSVSSTEENPLLESRVFSHEEAESIYMSMVSNHPTATSRYLPMPGAWDEADTGDLDPNNAVQRRSTETERPESRRLFVQAPDETDLCLIHNESKHKLMTQRKFIDMEHLEIWLPIVSDGAVEDPFEQKLTQTATHSAVNPVVPGTWNELSASQTRTSSIRPPLGEPVKQEDQKISAPTCLELVISALKMQVDLSLCSDFGRIVQTFLGNTQSSKPRRNDQNSAISNESNDETLPYPLRLRIRRLSADILNQHPMELCDLDRWGNVHISAEQPLLKASKTILGVDICNLSLDTSDFTRYGAKVELQTFVASLSESPVISFDPATVLKSSARSLPASSKDISLVYSIVKGAPDLSLVTLPVRIAIDLNTLDQVTESVGELSTLFESLHLRTPKTGVASSPRSPKPHRAVHFETDVRKPSRPGHPMYVRTNVRLGGSSIIVRSTEHAIKVDTSAVKMVGREGIIGLQIDQLRLSGIAHTTSDETSQPGLSLRLSNLGVKFLSIPEEQDLARLIALLTPSRDRFEKDDDILVDTLIRQRRGGSVLRVSIGSLRAEVDDLNIFSALQSMKDDIPSLAAMTRFLPQESRPGTMTLLSLSNAVVQTQTEQPVGKVFVQFKGAEVAHVGCPTLLALGVESLGVALEDGTKLVEDVTPSKDDHNQPPMLMARVIGEDLEPTLKLKFWNTTFEYSVPLLMAFQKSPGDPINQEMMSMLSTSIVALPDIMQRSSVGAEPTMSETASSSPFKIVKLDVALRDCAIGLTPRDINSRGLFLLSDVHVSSAIPVETGLDLQLELRKASLFLVNDVANLDINLDKWDASQQPVIGNCHMHRLSQQGYVSVCTILRAAININVEHVEDGSSLLDISLKNELFVLETCADSTQTLNGLLSGLSLPTPPSEVAKYQTEIAPLQDMISSLTTDAFSRDGTGQSVDFDQDEENFAADDLEAEFDCLGDFAEVEGGSLDDDHDEDDLTAMVPPLKQSFKPKTTRGMSREHIIQGEGLLGGLSPLPLPPSTQTFASKWDSSNNRYIAVTQSELAKAPLRIKARDMHIIWNLYDGYDWQSTRDTISKAVAEVESKAEERRLGKRVGRDEEEDEESVIGDFLFNSIYIGVPVNHDPRELTRQINRNLDDLVSETGSQASTMTAKPVSAQRGGSMRPRRLKLERSKRHKVAFELRGVAADIFNFPSGGETQSSIDVRIHDFEIFDHVPTSTWKKFATYMHDAGSREEKKPMVHLEICNVKPVPTLAASELVIRVSWSVSI